MNNHLSYNSPWQNLFWAGNNSQLQKTLLILTGVLVLAFASQLSIPLQPVPLSFQSATVILIGMAYGPRYGSYVIALYLLAGASGLPVFADYSGSIVKFFGPTGGYLLGFLPAAYLSGWLAQNGFSRNVFTSFIAAAIGASIIFASGVLFLAHFTGWENAIKVGLMPFLLSEFLKLMAVAFFIPRLWNKQ